MMPAQPRLLVSWLIAAVVLGIIAWRLWRRGKMRFSALEAVVFKQTPEGWTFDSPYPRIFSRRRSTYLLTDVEKERLAGRLRRGLRKVQIVIFGVCVLAAVSLAFWLPDVLRALRAGSPAAWLLFFLVLVSIGGMLASAVVITHHCSL
jgi:hypothetical protein